jgi:PadR family transcriptional regulator PadR
MCRYLLPIFEGRNVLKDFFLGFIKIHILYHASREPIYGVEILKELERHGYRLSPGTLYPTLHRLEKEGYLESRSKVVGGKVRKYYTITGRGLIALNEARQKIAELVNEVLLDK